MSDASLYERLGGEKKIHKLAASIYDNHGKNKAVSSRFTKSDRNKVIGLVAQFICAGTGGPQTYAGKDMIAAHKGMNISEREFVAVLDDILEALKSNGVGRREQEELLMIAYSLRGDILHV